ncbi:MAG: hypothetical protein KAS32_22200 [Candidatus Peribacteraceae bacterium]|nr:hypothetical protein [Candidatus Peribacteraceae bacterium]
MKTLLLTSVATCMFILVPHVEARKISDFIYPKLLSSYEDGSLQKRLSEIQSPPRGSKIKHENDQHKYRIQRNLNPISYLIESYYCSKGQTNYCKKNFNWSFRKK